MFRPTLPPKTANSASFQTGFLKKLLALCRQLLSAVDPKEVEVCLTAMKNCLVILIAANVSLPVRRLALGVTFGDFMSQHVQNFMESVWPEDRPMPEILPYVWKMSCRGAGIFAAHYYDHWLQGWATALLGAQRVGSEVGQFQPSERVLVVGQCTIQLALDF